MSEADLKTMSVEALINMRDLEKEKIVKTEEKIKDSIKNENYRLVLKYKEAMGQMVEQWVRLHLAVANRQGVSINDPSMKNLHRMVLDVSGRGEQLADNYYIKLKQKRKEEKRAEKRSKDEKAQAELEKRYQAEQANKKPVLKELFLSEIKEVNKLLAENVKRLEARQITNAEVLETELKYIEERYEKAVKAYNQFVVLSVDNPREVAPLREVKNDEERTYRRDLMKIRAFLTGLQKNQAQQPVATNQQRDLRSPYLIGGGGGSPAGSRSPNLSKKDNTLPSLAGEHRPMCCFEL